jgi:hypothetical protein
MIIGILCGLNKISQKKALEYYEAIHEVGHQAIIFSRPPFIFDRPHLVCDTKDSMFDAAYNSNAEFFMLCNDNLGDIVSRLNQDRGMPFTPIGASLKTNLKNLDHSFDYIETWENLDEVPPNTEIFIKPNNGSGGVPGADEGDPWSYKMFESKDAFIKSLENYGGLHRFNFSQENAGWMGKYIFQEYIKHDYVISHHFLNDGVSMPFSRIDLPINYKITPYKWKINSGDDFNFAKNTRWGSFSIFQALPTESIPKITDYNLRCPALLSIFYKIACPGFYTTFFDNLLNKQRNEYLWKASEVSIIPPVARANYNNLYDLPAYDFYGSDEKSFGVLLHD